MNAPLILVGGGEHASVVADAARLQGFSIEGYSDLKGEALVEQSAGIRYLGTDEETAATQHDKLFVICIGIIEARVKAAQYLERLGVRFATIVHPRATVAAGTRLEAGVAIMAGAIVNHGSVIGAHAILNSGSIVEHDVVVGRFTHVAPGVAIGGGAKIGDRTLIGLGARVRDHISIGDDVVVGMGSTVVKAVRSNTRVMGVPARLC